VVNPIISSDGWMNRSIRGMVAAICVNAEELVPPEGLLFGDHSVLLVG
jgi:hypothetical protein